MSTDMEYPIPPSTPYACIQIVLGGAKERGTVGCYKARNAFILDTNEAIARCALIVCISKLIKSRVSANLSSCCHNPPRSIHSKLSPPTRFDSSHPFNFTTRSKSSNSAHPSRLIKPSSPISTLLPRLPSTKPIDRNLSGRKDILRTGEGTIPVWKGKEWGKYQRLEPLQS